MKERIKLSFAVLLLVVLVPYMITLFFQEETEGLYQNTDTAKQLEEKVVLLLSEEISGQAQVEAIKAQAVIARTQLYCKPELEVTGNQENLKENIEVLRFCVEATQGEILTFNDVPIDAAYHRVSGATTRNGSEVPGQEDKSYLRSVDSSVDIEAKEYLTIFYLEKEELAAAIQKLLVSEGTEKTQNTGKSYDGKSNNLDESDGVKQDDNTAIQQAENITVNPDTILVDLVIEERDSAKYVTKLRYKETVFSGEALRCVLELPSSLVYFSELEGNVRVMTKGLGHGLGLSQYGASAMAAEGKNYKEILRYYYTGVRIEKI